jgi:hypothetical protein
MIQTTFSKFHKYRYSMWNVDISELKNNKMLNLELNDAFDSSDKTGSALEKVGDGVTLLPNVLSKMKSFSFLLDFITKEKEKQLTLLGIPKFYINQKPKIERCWANRIFKDTYGTIHNHLGGRTVFLLYYNVPKNSSDIVFIHPKHKDKMYQSEEIIPENEKIKISVKEGMCLLHDGRILHAVSKHNSDTPRDVIVFEFDTIYGFSSL